MEIQFGEIKLTVPYEKYLQKYSMENPFLAMFSRPNQESFNDFTKKTTTDYSKFFEEYKKWMENAIKMSKLGKNED